MSGDVRLAAFWSAQQVRLTAVLDGLVPPGARVFYLDYPVSSNVGDLLLYHGTEAWLSKSGHQVVGRASIIDFRFPRLAADVAILCQGGGNFGDLYRHQRFREAVVARYPGNRIVFLPQTVHYQSAQAIAESRRRLSAHDDLHLVLREHRSLALAEQYFPGCRTYLAPDMAVMLYPITRQYTRSGPGGQLCLFRRDKERPAEHLPTRGCCTWEGDWKQILGVHYIALRLLQALIITAGTLGPTSVTARVWKAFTWQLVQRSAARFLAADRIETSRLHGHIFAVLLGVPSRLHDNSYGKNAAYFRCWHKPMALADDSLILE
ncbi:polysaccharide pyruvyl transferase family protein [uncultured Thiohalocapsa sp.]|uniref:polysaccharide pyruvyl transferase family protein n=1 Tax=uncultured Thiohalocapsa sp. TaxID=768990 RepID=UPI0025FC5144|nr:polysaccharide pyruvyl transferase family protein [uncultured Thiohalocapsa sp.]